MRILIVSDTHKHNENLIQVLEEEGRFDMFIHCGDGEGLEDTVRELIKCPIYIVAGNNDYFSNLQSELIFNIGDNKVMLTHGHYQYVSMGPERLATEAKARGVNIVMYGHTHRPKMEIIDDVVMINPGSISYPRQNGRIPTYMVMELDNDGNCTYTLKYCRSN